MALTTEQIHELCARRDVGVVAAAASTYPAAAALVRDVSPEQLRVLVAEGVAARNTLVEAYAGLVKAVVNRTVKGGQHTGDYVQEGMVALIDSVDRYDPNRGNLAAYARPRIKGAVLSLLSIRGGELHLNTNQARAKELVRSTTRRLTAAGLPVSSSDVADHLGKPEEWVQRHADYRRPASFSAPGFEGLEVPDAKAQQAMEAVEVSHLTKYLDLLPGPERTALQLLHGITGDRHSLAGVSDTMGISRRLAERYVAAGHTHLGQLIAHFEQGLYDGQAAARTRVEPTRGAVLDRPSNRHPKTQPPR